MGRVGVVPSIFLLIVLSAGQLLEDVDAVQPNTCTRSMGRRMLVDKARSQLLPRTIHQIVLEGQAALDEWSFEPTTGFQRHWQTSCVVNNPDWKYHLWTEEDAIALIEKDYPWLEDLYNSYSTNAMKSELLRILILHSEGGMYIDLDTECYKPLDEFIEGYQAVFQGDGSDSVLSTAHMAAVPSHPVFALMVKNLSDFASSTDFSYSAEPGPKLLKQSLEAWLNLRGQTSDDGILGTHTGPDGSLYNAYPLGQWFSPCMAGDMNCLQAITMHRPTMKQQSQLSGIHWEHDPWTGGKRLDEGMQLQLEATRIHGAITYLLDPRHFREALCQDPLRLARIFDGTVALSRTPSRASSGGDPEQQAISSGDMAVCMDMVEAAVHADSCVVYTVRGQQAGGGLDLQLEQHLADLGCSVHLLATGEDPPLSGDHVLSGIHIHHVALSPNGEDDESTNPPHLSLATALERVGHDGNRITLLYVDAGDAGWQLPAQLSHRGSALLRHVDSLMMELPPLQPSRARLADALVTHLLQEGSFVGYGYLQVHPDQLDQPSEQHPASEVHRLASTGLDGLHGVPVGLRMGFLQQQARESVRAKGHHQGGGHRHRRHHAHL